MEVLTYMKQISKFMDRDENSGQVQGPLVKFTLREKREYLIKALFSVRNFLSFGTSTFVVI